MTIGRLVSILVASPFLLFAAALELIVWLIFVGAEGFVTLMDVSLGRGQVALNGFYHSVSDNTDNFIPWVRPSWWAKFWRGS